MKVHLFDRELDNKVPSLNKAKVHGFKMSACGYQREVVTTNKDEVTCKACLKKMKYLENNKKSRKGSKMKLNKFIDDLFGCVADKEGIENIKKCISDNIDHDYNTTQIELQLLEDENNYDVDMSIYSENYNDGEVIFLDLRNK